MHYNRPALITRVGGLDEFIVEGRTGLFASTQPDDIAKQIDFFLNQDQEAYIEAIKEEKKRFSWDAFVAHFQSFYSEKFAS
ncbi:MAG: glycosyltransferase [Cryomorphaceae bacterium]